MSPLPLRDRARVALAFVRPFVGTLLVVPLVAVLFGSEWTLERSVVPSRTWRVTPGTVNPAADDEVRLHFYEDGADPGRGVELGDDLALRGELPRAVSRFVVVLQADLDDRFVVLGGEDPAALEPLWQVPRDKKGAVLQTRRSPLLEVSSPVRVLEVQSLRGFGGRSVSGLRLELEPRRFRHVLLAPLLWGAFALLVLACGRVPGAARVLDAWRRADPWLAAVVVVAIVFQVPEAALFLGAVAVAVGTLLWLLRAWLARSPASLAATAAVLVILALVVPRVFRAALTARIAELHDLTVDHRPRPGGEIYEDRLRFTGVASDLADDDFVVLFLGDSFTHGVNLAYQDTYPAAFEEAASGFECSAPVRAVNGGWTSASPLLGLRLAREVGPRYRPDLVIYSLDMTDFHDDLLYERRLEEGGDLEVDTGRALVQLLARAVPGLSRPRLDRMGQLLRAPAPGRPGDEPPLPADRFFATSLPLAASRPHIERGVMKNLGTLHELSRDTLDAGFALVVYPRAYQYSLRESPDNWERHDYEVLGPWVREPFRYFEEKAPGLPWAVLSLLPTFEQSETFPLFLSDDPHWNEAGARLVGETVAGWAAGSGLIPCQPPDLD